MHKIIIIILNKYLKINPTKNNLKVNSTSMRLKNFLVMFSIHSYNSTVEWNQGSYGINYLKIRKSTADTNSVILGGNQNR